MAEGNWIKLNRKIQENFIWDFEKPRYAMAWIDLLLTANYKDKQIIFDGKVETVERGSLITSMVKLSERWCMNRKTVKAFLDILHDAGMITYKTSKRRTTIYITNYLAYQDFEAFQYESTGQLTGQPDGQLDGQPDGQVTGQLTGHNIRREEGKTERLKEGKKERCCYDGANDPVASVLSDYLNRINPTASPSSLDELRSYAEDMGKDVCIRAFDIALDNKKTTWPYIRAILRDKLQRGVKCLADWDALEAERENAKPGHKNEPQDYGDPEDFYK